jgi:hypothetical protein
MESYLGYQHLGYGPNFNIALNMSLDQLKFYCTSNELFGSICMNQEFWLERIRREYPITIPYKPENVTWSQYYFDAPIVNDLLIYPTIIPENVNIYDVAQDIKNGTIKLVYVTYKGEKIGKILMINRETVSHVVASAIKLLTFNNLSFDASTQVFLTKFATSDVPRDVGITGGNIKKMLNSNMSVNGIFGYTNRSLWNDLEVIQFSYGRFDSAWKLPVVWK